MSCAGENAGDAGGANTTCQCLGAEGSLSGLEDILTRPEAPSSTPANGQCDGNCCFKLHGRTHSIPLSKLAVVIIWEWCIRREVTLHAEHLPEVENIRADWLSHHLVDSSDWRLMKMVFLGLESMLGSFSITLFPSRMNALLETYCSWNPDPGAMAVDALSIS